MRICDGVKSVLDLSKVCRETQMKSYNEFAEILRAQREIYLRDAKEALKALKETGNVMAGACYQRDIQRVIEIDNKLREIYSIMSTADPISNKKLNSHKKNSRNKLRLIKGGKND